MPYYQVTIADCAFSPLVKAANSIGDARRWARTAFPKQATSVARTWTARGCPDCDGLCCCARSRRQYAATRRDPRRI